MLRNVYNLLCTSVIKHKKTIIYLFVHILSISQSIDDSKKKFATGKVTILVVIIV